VHKLLNRNILRERLHLLRLLTIKYIGGRTDIHSFLTGRRESIRLAVSPPLLSNSAPYKRREACYLYVEIRFLNTFIKNPPDREGTAETRCSLLCTIHGLNNNDWKQ